MFALLQNTLVRLLGIQDLSRLRGGEPTIQLTSSVPFQSSPEMVIVTSKGGVRWAMIPQTALVFAQSEIEFRLFTEISSTLFVHPLYTPVLYILRRAHF